MKELEELAIGLVGTNTLLLKEKGNLLECQFLVGGLVRHTVQVKCKYLAAALKQQSVLGIIEGGNFISFRSKFSGFSLHVKTKKLYNQLSASQPEMKTMAVA